MKLRKYLLLLFFLLATVPVLLMRFWPHSEALNQQVAEVRGRHLLLAQNLAASLERYHRDLSATFELFLSDPKHWQDQHSDDVKFLSNLSFRHICIADLRTGIVIDSLAPSTTPCPEVLPAETRAYFMQNAREGEVVFGPVKPALSGENVMHLARIRDGKLAIGAIYTDYFQQLGRSISFGIRGHAAIMDHEGNVLSHPLDDWVAERRNVRRLEVVSKVLAGQSGITTFYSPALDTDMIAGFAPVSSAGWGVMVPQPLQELKSKAAAIQRSTVIVMGIGVGIAFVLAILVSLQVSRPVEQMSAVSRGIARGRFAQVAPFMASRFLPAEMRELQANFRNMIDRLARNTLKINELAFRDTVTPLANREWFRRRLTAMMSRDSENDKGALLFFDLDGFKAVNDAHGHDVGDEVLKGVASRIEELFGTQDLDDLFSKYTNPLAAPLEPHPKPLLARLGGDEFAIYVAEKDMSQVEDMADALLARLGEPFDASGQFVQIGCSIGIARYPQAGDSYGSLLKSADIAMYSAKRAGKTRYCHFSADLRQKTAARKAMADEMMLAIECYEIVPYFQPQYDARTQELVGVEALARWHHPSRGVLLPRAFLSVADELRLMSVIDQRIMHSAIDTLKQVATLGGRIPDLSVNLSAQRLADPHLIEQVQDLGDLPFRMNFELVESIYFDRIDDRTAWALEQLEAQGHGIELDDFGSGHASITALLTLQPQTLKIDGLLVNQIGTDGKHRELVRSIIEMGRALDIGVTAECVETQEQIDILRDFGCQRLQGNFLSPPVPAGDFIMMCLDDPDDRDVLDDIAELG